MSTKSTKHLPTFYLQISTLYLFTIFTVTLPPNADHSQNDENKPRAEYRNKDH